jgi:hypothetical protein
VGGSIQKVEREARKADKIRRKALAKLARKEKAAVGSPSALKGEREYRSP